VQSKSDRRQIHHDNAIIGKNLPGRLAVDVGLNEGVSHVVGGMCVSVERDEEWFGGEVEVSGLSSGARGGGD